MEMGHLVRSLALADRLAERFRVMLLNGGRLPKGIAVPSRVQLVNLPPVGIGESEQLVSHDKRISLAGAMDRRQKMIRVCFDNLRPAVVLVELFPFGRQQFAGELTPLLQAACSHQTRSLVVCSLRDILVSKRQDQQRHDERAAALANEFFDLILVHSDPSFARFEESFRPRTRLAVPVEYTGFVVPTAACPARVESERKKVVVSTGSGLNGESLLRTAIEAQSHLAADPPVEMKLIAGPFLPDDTWLQLLKLARGKKRVRLMRHVSDLCGELSSAAASVSHAGYNTCLDVLRAGAPALLVPFAKNGEDEQRRRALRLQDLGVVKVAEQKELTPEQLALKIRELIGSKTARPALDLSGAQKSAALIESIVFGERHELRMSMASD